MSRQHPAWYHEYAAIAITDEVTLGDLATSIEENFPKLLGCLAPHRLSPGDLEELFLQLDSAASTFEGGHRGGRGDGYRVGQLTAGVRKVAVGAIHSILGNQSRIIVDVLGGNGTFARTLDFLKLKTQRDILCCDIARDMVAHAYLGGQAAWRQSADFMLLGDNCVDAVLFLYGTHHIPPELLPASFQEAYRVLKPGGRVCVQDFEEHTPSAQWFSLVLDRYTTRGHNFRHFLPGEMSRLLREAGFISLEERRLYDPLEIHASTEEAAFDGLLSYLATTYELTSEGQADLPELVHTYGRCDQATWNTCEFTEVTVAPRTEGYEAVMPRMSLVAWGTK